jgi:hypothetical protein
VFGSGYFGQTYFGGYPGRPAAPADTGHHPMPMRVLADKQACILAMEDKVVAIGVVEDRRTCIGVQEDKKL